MKIISFKLCPYVQRAIALLELKGVPYEVSYIDLKNKPEWFLQISPMGKVPVLVTDNETVLFESNPICEYIDEVYEPRIHPANPEKRALHRAWSEIAASAYMYQYQLFTCSNPEAFEKAVQAIQTLFQRVENSRAQTRFFDSDEITVTDTAWLPLFYRLHLIAKYTNLNIFEAFPRTQVWKDELLRTGLHTQSTPSDFEELFVKAFLQNTENHLHTLAN